MKNMIKKQSTRPYGLSIYIFLLLLKFASLFNVFISVFKDVEKEIAQ